MSTPFLRKSRTLSMLPALAALRKLVLLSDWREEDRKETDVRKGYIMLRLRINQY